MRHMITGQLLLIACCVFYLIWWYRGFRPNVEADRIGGLNGCLLLITAVLGIAGILFSLLPTPETVVKSIVLWLFSLVVLPHIYF